MKDLFEKVKANPSYFRQLVSRTLLFTQYDCPQETVFQNAFSDHNFIIYVLSGRRVFFQPGFNAEMTSGKCVFSKKGGWLSQKEPGEGWCVMVFFIPDQYLQQFYTEHHHLFPLHRKSYMDGDKMINLAVNEVTRGFFDSMVPYFSQDPPPPESLLELKFRELLFNLLINPQNENFLQQVQNIAAGYHPSLSEIMDANFTYNLSLKNFAKLTHLSLASFKREFKRVYKTSPGKWLIRKRLDHAGMLIVTTAKSINEIAYESGFENTTHFSRVFKEKFGTSPLQYRKQFITEQVAY